MTKVFFVRHAQPEPIWDDEYRPLTAEGLSDVDKVTDFFKMINVDKFYCSPYKRSIQTIEAAARYFDKEIIIDQRLRERDKGTDSNNYGMF